MQDLRLWIPSTPVIPEVCADPLTQRRAVRADAVHSGGHQHAGAQGQKGPVHRLHRRQLFEADGAAGGAWPAGAPHCSRGEMTID